MTADDVVLYARVGWLVLCGMMVLSRIAFQAAGSTWMRSFLDTWKVSWTKQVWGWVACLLGFYLMLRASAVAGAMGAADRLVVFSFVVVACSDGLLNLFPDAFGQFKERMQAAWVRRHPDERGSDRHLFGIVNLALGLAAGGVAAAVALYRPLSVATLLYALGLALVVMVLLIRAGAAEMELRRPPPAPGPAVPLVMSDRLLSVRPELESIKGQLLYADRKALREGRCREVAARIRRRQAWLSWTLVPFLGLALLLSIVWGVRSASGVSAAYLAGQLLTTLIVLLVTRRRSLAVARRLEEFGDPAGPVPTS